MYQWIFIVSCFVAFLVTWGIGANDLANSFGTAYGSKVLTIKQIVIIAGICEFSGAVLLGSEVSRTVAGSITANNAFDNDPYVFMYGMFSVLVATATWLFVATAKSLPVSTTHSVIGAVIGFALVFRGGSGVRWSESADEFPYVKGVVPVFISWVTSPLLAMLVAMLVFGLLRRFVLRQTSGNASFRTAVSFVIITFVTVWLNLFFIFSKGMKEELGWSVGKSAWVSLLIGLGVAIGVAIASPKLAEMAKRAAEEERDAAAVEALEERKRKLEDANREHLEEMERIEEERKGAANSTTNEDEQRPQKQEGGSGSGERRKGPIILNDIPVVASASINVPAAGPAWGAAEGGEQGAAAPKRVRSNSGEPDAPPAYAPITGGSPSMPRRSGSVQFTNQRRTSTTEPFSPGAFPFANSSMGSMRRSPQLRRKSLKAALPTEPTAFSNNVMTVFNESFGSIAAIMPAPDDTERFNPEAEWIFKILQIFSAMVISFAHGANDVSNSIGALAAVYAVERDGRVPDAVGVEIWMLAMGGAGITLGLATMGQRILKVLGEEMVILTPSRGFSAQFAASLVVSFASSIGLPISTTHAITGAVIGIGLVEGASHVEWGTVGRTAVGWVLTLIVTAVASGLFFAQGLYAPNSRNIFS